MSDEGYKSRRFKRVHFRSDIGQANRILGARLVWPNLETSEVFDLSFKGFAATRPALVEPALGTKFEVSVEFGELTPFVAIVKVVWLRDALVGLELGDLPANAHMIMHEFLSDKLIGQSMVRVDQKYFAPGQDFHYWYVGADSTNMFVWCDTEDPARVNKLRLEFNDEIWQFENRRVTKGEKFNQRAIQILGHVNADDLRLKDAIEKVAASE